jgi:hypothetical protein
MASGAKPLTFEEFAERLSAVFDQVEAQGEEITVEREGKLFTLRPKRKRSRRKGGPITADDPLWDIVGIGKSKGPTDVSSNKYKYVAEAIASHFEKPFTGQQVTQAHDEGDEEASEPLSNVSADA